ncbi:MAG: nucleotide exchange factor GrpE, partial [Pseudomonadota bacterium]
MAMDQTDARDADAAAEGGAAAADAPEAGAPTNSAAPDAPLDPETRLAEVEAERDELKDRLYRALAENENIRKRAERDVKEAQAYGGSKLARDLLAVHDNLARALEAMNGPLRESAGPVLEGVELTQRELLNAFARHAIEAVAPEIGDRFDAKLHQAMFEAPMEGIDPGRIIQVMQHGFTISGRL